MAFNKNDRNATSEFLDKIVAINRVAKVVKGGKRFSFSALVVVGDGKGKVGIGLGKAAEVPEAIRKGSEKAKKTMTSVPLMEGTIPYAVKGKFGAAEVVMKPARGGTGIIAGGPVRAILEAAGFQNILTKSEQRTEQRSKRDFFRSVETYDGISLAGQCQGIEECS